MQNNPVVVVTVEGGVIQSIVANTPVDVIVLDFDTDGADDRVITIEGNDCRVSMWDAEVDKPKVDLLWTQNWRW